MQTLAERIANRRKELGLRQADLAEAAGVSEAAVSQWERGETKNLKLENLFAIADALRLHARWLAIGEGPRFVKAAMLALLAVTPLIGLCLDRLGCVLCQILAKIRQAREALHITTASSQDRSIASRRAACPTTRQALG